MKMKRSEVGLLGDIDDFPWIHYPVWICGVGLVEVVI